MPRRKPVPKVQCAKCPSLDGAGKLGLCPTCRLEFFRKITYPWTPAMDDKLRAAYRVTTKKELTRQLTELQRLFRFPRHILTNRAQTLGLAVIDMNPWTDDEIEFVREHAGSMSLKKLAACLHRNIPSVKHLIHRKGMLGQCVEGYSGNELRTLLSVAYTQIEAWHRRGLLKRNGDIGGRFTHESVRRFCLHHIEEISLRRVDERWLKMMIREEMECGLSAGRKAIADAHQHNRGRNAYSKLRTRPDLNAVAPPSAYDIATYVLETLNGQ